MLCRTPNVDPQRRYNIKEFCEQLGVCRDTIRKYTKNGVIVPIVITCREIYYLGSEIMILHEHLTKNSSAYENR